MLRLVVALVASVASQRRISGGGDAEAFRYQWMANINLDGRHYCGGVFLSPSALITAAHCSDNPRGAYAVEFHRHNISAPAAGEAAQSSRVADIVVHPAYRGKTAPNDIAVWKLASPIQGPFETVQLDAADRSAKEGLAVVALGWGKSSPGGEFSQALQQVTLPVVDFSRCGLVWLLRGPSLDRDLQFCAGGQGGEDVCLGDSGGPLFRLEGATPVLLGLTSFGQPCANRGVPSVFTKVASFRDFIQQSL